jgi:hypothetical protein
MLLLRLFLFNELGRNEVFYNVLNTYDLQFVPVNEKILKKQKNSTFVFRKLTNENK